MAWQAFIHFKNDNEIRGEERMTFPLALVDLERIVDSIDNKDTILYAQVENTDEA